MQKMLFLLLILFFTGCANSNNKEEEDHVTVREITAFENEIEHVNLDTIRVETTDSVNNMLEEIGEEVVKNEPEEVVKPKPKPKKQGKIVVQTPIHEFGRKTEGDTVEHTFHFTNMGEEDLLINNVLVDCGCTVPEFPKEAISPGQASSISVTFNTKGKMGMQERIITILTNGEPKSKIVRLKGIVDTE